MFVIQLLSGLAPDGAEGDDTNSSESDNNMELEKVVLRSKLQQSEELVKDLREELSNVRNECMQLQGIKVHTSYF